MSTTMNERDTVTFSRDLTYRDAEGREQTIVSMFYALTKQPTVELSLHIRLGDAGYVKDNAEAVETWCLSRLDEAYELAEEAGLPCLSDRWE